MAKKNMQLLPRKSILAIAAVIDIALHARRGGGRARKSGSGRLIEAGGASPGALEDAVAHQRLQHRLQVPWRQPVPGRERLGPSGGYELAREQRRITADEILRAAGTVDDIESKADRPVEAARSSGDAGAFGSRAGVHGRAVAHQSRGTDALSRATGLPTRT